MSQPIPSPIITVPAGFFYNVRDLKIEYTPPEVLDKFNNLLARLEINDPTRDLAKALEIDCRLPTTATPQGHSGSHFIINDEATLNTLSKKLDIPPDKLAAITFEKTLKGIVPEIIFAFMEDVAPTDVALCNRQILASMEKLGCLQSGTTNRLGAAGHIPDLIATIDTGPKKRHRPNYNALLFGPEEVTAIHFDAIQNTTGVEFTVKQRPDGTTRIVFGHEVPDHASRFATHLFVTDEEMKAAKAIWKLLAQQLPGANATLYGEKGQTAFGVGITVNEPLPNVLAVIGKAYLSKPANASLMKEIEAITPAPHKPAAQHSGSPPSITCG